MALDKAPCGNMMLNGWDAHEIAVNAHDRAILRALAAQVAELAARPIEAEKVRLWTRHNDLKTDQPVILADPENGWNEILPYASTIRCQGAMAQEWEMWLRKEICWGTKIRDDRPVEAVLYLPYRATDSGWGLDRTVIGDPSKGEAYTWTHPIDDDMMDADIDLGTLIQTPQITIDRAATEKAVACAADVFEGLLEIRLRHRWWWSLDLSLSYSNMRGLSGMMTDFYEYPDKVHEMLELFTRGYLAKLDQLEALGVLPNNARNCYIGSGGIGLTEDLQQQADFDPARLTTRDIWGFNEAQETSEISPDMFKSFFLPYQIRLAERFGLNYYGCCEGLDRRFAGGVDQIPRLRRVSVSMWSDARAMSEMLGSRYVFCRKPSPTDLAMPQMDEDFVRTELNRLLKMTKANGNIVELDMKDNHTLGNNPENLYRWVQVAREEIARVYG